MGSIMMSMFFPLAKRSSNVRIWIVEVRRTSSYRKQMVSYGHCAPQITYRCKMAPDFFPRASDVPAMFAILLEYAEEPANTLLIIVVFLTL
jgi:hypothetical protein